MKKRNWAWNKSTARWNKANSELRFIPARNNNNKQKVKNMKEIDLSGKYELPLMPNGAQWPGSQFPDCCDDKQLLEWYNKYSGKTELAKFANRGVALRWCKQLKEAMDILRYGGKKQKVKNMTDETTNNNGNGDAGEKSTKSKKSKASKTKASKKSKSTKASKKERNGGGKFEALVVVKKAKECPWRDGSEKAKTWKLIKDGMNYAKLIAAGGRKSHVRSGVKKGFLVLKAA